MEIFWTPEDLSPVLRYKTFSSTFHENNIASSLFQKLVLPGLKVYNNAGYLYLSIGCYCTLALPNHADFVGIILILLENPESQSLGDVVIFSQSSHERKQNAEYLTLMSQKTEEIARNIK